MFPGDIAKTVLLHAGRDAKGRKTAVIRWQRRKATGSETWRGVSSSLKRLCIMYMYLKRRYVPLIVIKIFKMTLK